MFNLKGRVAVITGGSTGLGKQMAKALAKHGADLVIISRDVDKLSQAKVELDKEGVKVIVIECDVTKTDQIEFAKKVVMSKFDKVDILINCAGA